MTRTAPSSPLKPPAFAAGAAPLLCVYSPAAVENIAIDFIVLRHKGLHHTRRPALVLSDSKFTGFRARSLPSLPGVALDLLWPFLRTWRIFLEMSLKICFSSLQKTTLKVNLRPFGLIELHSLIANNKTTRALLCCPLLAC